VWWSLLDRGDLPDDSDGAAPLPRRHTDDTASGPVVPEPRERARRRVPGWVFNVAALLVGLLIVMIGLGVDSARGALTVALIFGVPMLLVVITVSIAARRAR